MFKRAWAFKKKNPSHNLTLYVRMHLKVFVYMNKDFSHLVTNDINLNFLIKIKKRKIIYKKKTAKLNLRNGYL